ncbi:hypothetical protein RISK_002536 [Rhodopirellula islandica]|uniref:Uncharacterized protein n=2 Tax=Rhodopirellula islandica TaxID=595434 RepID=A0A0J1EIV9_RHOIS|nr:hypothetical protein RISK_002536 [Rhodopirellula islandica]
MFHRVPNQGEATLDLEQLTIVAGNQTSSLDKDSLSKLLRMSPANPRDAEYVGALLRFIYSARDGTLPPPQHHLIELPTTLSGNMQHFASGTAVSPIQLLWIISWFGYGIRRLFSHRSGSSPVVSEA